jgi:hypothetical protein
MPPGANATDQLVLISIPGKEVNSALGYFQIKLKIQNDKQSLFPDTFMLDWDNLSETELKRLVVQLEKTKNDVFLGSILQNSILAKKLSDTFLP